MISLGIDSIFSLWRIYTMYVRIYDLGLEGLNCPSDGLIRNDLWMTWSDILYTCSLVSAYSFLLPHCYCLLLMCINGHLTSADYIASSLTLPKRWTVSAPLLKMKAFGIHRWQQVVIIGCSFEWCISMCMILMYNM